MDKRKMTREEAMAWQERWRLVNEYQAEELRRMTIEEKFAKTQLLFQIAQSLEMRTPEYERELAEVRARWLKLKLLYENGS